MYSLFFFAWSWERETDKYKKNKIQAKAYSLNQSHVASLREKELEKKKCQQIALQLEEKTKQFQKLQVTIFSWVYCLTSHIIYIRVCMKN